MYVGKHEVTQQQWEKVMGWNFSVVKGELLPITNISLVDILEFCTRLSEKEGIVYRLPRSNEWYYICQPCFENDNFLKKKNLQKYINYDNVKLHPK